jgi:hypothetical protein
MVEQRGERDAKKDGNRPLVPRGEGKRKELGLVADFGQGDQADGR